MDMLRNAKVGTKLQVAFGLITLLSVIMGLVALVVTNRIGADAVKIATQHVPRLIGSDRVAIGIANLRRAELGIVNAGQTKDASYLASARQAFQEAVAQIDGGLADLASSNLEGDEVGLLRQTREAYQVYRAHVDSVTALVDRAQIDAAAVAAARGSELFNATRAPIERFTSYQQTEASQLRTEVDAVHTSGRNVLLGVMVAIAIFGALFGATISRSLTNPLAVVVERAEHLRRVCVTELEKAITAMARGDLTVVPKSSTKQLDIERNDEIGQLSDTVNAMIAATQNTIGEFAASQSVVRQLVADNASLTAAAVAGRLGVRGDPTKYQGSFRELVVGMNQTLEAIMTPLEEAGAVLEKLAARDLTARLGTETRGDFTKLKTAINGAAQNLDEALGEVFVASMEVAAASDQISASSGALADGASRQASSLEEVSSSLQEMSSMSRQSSANAKESRALAEGARSSSLKGADDMQRLATAMDKIKRSSDATAKIVKTIDEIAFQTNLLALNAAVEAARAGDAGKGFAVVAEEVRNLAMRSAEAARNTATLIEESVANAGQGVSLSEGVAKSFVAINTGVGRVADVMAEVSAATEQQTVGMTQISTAVDQMNGVTQQVAAGSEESASSAVQLNGQSTRMRELVSRFRISRTADVPAERQRSSRTTHAPAPLAVPAHAKGATTKAATKNPALTKPTPVFSAAVVPKFPAGATAPTPHQKPNGRKLTPVDPESVIPFNDDGDDDVLQQF